MKYIFLVSFILSLLGTVSVPLLSDSQGPLIGLVDTSFGNNGLAMTPPILNTTAFATGVIVEQSTQDIITTGFSQGASFNILLARFSPNGQLVRYAAYPQSIFITVDGIVEQAGQFLIGGTQEGIPTSMFVARYHSDLSLDTTYGTASGFTFINPDGPAQNATGGTVLLDASGRTVTCGSSTNVSGQQNFMLARLTPSGQLDTADFNAPLGTLTISLGSGVNSGILDIGFQSTGNIIALGFGNNNDATLVRVTPEGQLDTSFGNLGIADTGIACNAVALGLLVLPDDSLVMVGYSPQSTGFTQSVFVAKLTPQGVLDPSFGPSGTGVITFGVFSPSSNETVSPILYQPDGRILVIWNNAGTITVTRLTSDGLVDTTFGGAPSGQPGFMIYRYGLANVAFAATLVQSTQGFQAISAGAIWPSLSETNLSIVELVFKIDLFPRANTDFTCSTVSAQTPFLTALQCKYGAA